MSNRQLAHAQLDELRTAYAILMSQGVLEVFGHITFRCHSDENTFWLLEAGPPSDMVHSDLVAYDLEGLPVDVPKKSGLKHFSERFLHASIYAKRPDVMAICHHHSPAVMPFAVAGVALRPVSQTGASMGHSVPVWKSRQKFGDTRLLVTDLDQANDLAHELGQGWMVLMQNHGATVVATNLRELVFRAVYYCMDAASILKASAIGQPLFLTPGEIAHYKTLAPDPVNRSWEHWSKLPETQLLIS